MGWTLFAYHIIFSRKQELQLYLHKYKYILIQMKNLGC